MMMVEMITVAESTRKEKVGPITKCNKLAQIPRVIIVVIVFFWSARVPRFLLIQRSESVGVALAQRPATAAQLIDLVDRLID